MSPRLSPQLQSRLTAIALILASIGGTAAIFGFVPLLASLTSSPSVAQPVNQMPISDNQPLGKSWL